MLSIVIVTCNRCEELKKTIFSCEERVSVDHEYVVVDNGSTDGTESLILGLKKKEGLPINYLRQNKNLGVSGGRNEGYRKAKGEILYFIDDDATIISDGFCLDDAYNFMSSNRNIFAMGTDCYDTKRKDNLRGLHEKNVSSSEAGRIRGYIGCSHFVKKMFDENDYLYPNNLFYGSEELYVGLNILRNGGCVWYFPGLKVLHQPSINTRSSVQENKRNGHINTYVIKTYFLPNYVRWISTIMFFLRIARFEKCNFIMIVDDFKKAHKRIDHQYNKKLTLKQILLIKKRFGIKHIL